MTAPARILKPHPDDWPSGYWTDRRFRITLDFMARYAGPGSTVLDIGTENALGQHMKTSGYKVTYTDGTDLDYIPVIPVIPVKEPKFDRYEYDAATCYGILEHLTNPLGMLTSIPSGRLFAGVPLSLWFAKASRSKTNPAGQHFHEFEPWQLDWLLEKAGWKVMDRCFHTYPSFKPGIRTVLRWFTARWYIAYAERT